MIAFIKTILTFVFGFIFGFGFWYLIFWFVIGEPNLFVWGIGAKILYLIFGFLSTGSALDEIIK
jgi:hypothetical protein